MSMNIFTSLNTVNIRRNNYRCACRNVGELHHGQADRESYCGNLLFRTSTIVILGGALERNWHGWVSSTNSESAADSAASFCRACSRSFFCLISLFYLYIIYRPKGTQVVSPADRDIILKAGLAVVECSRARLDDVPFGKIASPHERLRRSFSII